MWIFVFLATVLSQMQDEQQLTHAACVIFSRFYLQNNQDTASRVIGEMIETQGLSKEDAILYTTASLVEQCLDNITKQETMEIISSLQSQQLGLEAHKHLVEKADLRKYGSKKKSSKKNEILKVIKQIDDIIMQQKREVEGDDGGDTQQQQEGGRKRQRNKNKQQDLPDLAIFDLKEWVVLSSFAIVGVLLSYIICCIPEKKKKEDKKKSKKVKPEETVEEDQEKKSDSESSEQEITENKEKPKQD